MVRLLVFVIGYVFGMIQTSYILGKMQGIDIRTKGSGNAGTTNALRVMGVKAGAITVAVDMLKCIFAVILVRIIFSGSDMLPLLCIWTAAGAVLGHDFPFLMGFKGGKGIAATGGMIIAFGDIRLIIIGIICFFLPVIITKYVSLGSLILSASFVIGLPISAALGCYGMTMAHRVEMCIIVLLLTILAYWQHRGNIQRLLTGTERKISFHKKGTEG